MKKLLLTSTLLFTSISCAENQRKEIVTKQKKELQLAQNKLSSTIDKFSLTDIVIKSEKLIETTSESIKNKKIPVEKEIQLKQSINNLEYCNEELERRIENAKEDLETSKNPNNGLKLLGSIYILAKHEKTQNKVIEILNKIVENVENILKSDEEKKFMDKTDKLYFEELVPTCKYIIKSLYNSNENKGNFVISLWKSQIEQFRVLGNNTKVQIDDKNRESIKEIVKEAEVAVIDKDLTKLKKLREERAIPLLEEIYNNLVKKETLTNDDEVVLIMLIKSLSKPSAPIVHHSRSISYEYEKVEKLINTAELHDTQEWKEIENKYNPIYQELRNFGFTSKSISNFEKYFKEMFSENFESSFDSLKNKLNEIKDIRLQKQISRVFDRLKAKLEDLRKKIN